MRKREWGATGLSRETSTGAGAFSVVFLASGCPRRPRMAISNLGRRAEHHREEAEGAEIKAGERKGERRSCSSEEEEEGGLDCRRRRRVGVGGGGGGREGMRKQCELCDLPARMYCESDQASLCWECDGKVHGANFLVARHTRSLLCRSCQAPTPWRASGSRLAPTLSLCERCFGAGAESSACVMEKGVAAGGGRIEAEEGGVEDLEIDDGEDDDEEERDEDEDEDEDAEEEDDEEGEEEEEEEDGDIQVVPWSTEAVASTPPPVASCSSSDESSSTRMATGRGFIRRVRQNANPSTSQDDLELGCSPSHSGYLRPSPPSTAVVARSGWMLDVHEAETNSVRHRKRTALPAYPPPSTNRPRDRRLHGASSTVDFFFPGSRSPPI